MTQSLLSWTRAGLRLLVGLAFVAMGTAHFTNSEMFAAIVPPYLPAALLLVYVSGVFEILGGLGILPAATRRFSGLGLLALLVAVFPANIHMALHPQQFTELSPAMLWVRLPFQFVFAALVWWVAVSPRAQGTASAERGSNTAASDDRSAEFDPATAPRSATHS